MKMRIALRLSLLALCLTLGVPAMSQVVYSNGPTNGNTDAWNVSSGFIVSDLFVVNDIGYNTRLNAINFALWFFANGPVLEGDVSITSGENGGTSYFNQTVNFTQGTCTPNNLGYNVCNESTNLNGGVTLANGTYWLNLQNVTTTNGDPAYWDENSGPSLASENEVGTIPSESFTILGFASTTTSTSTTTTGTVPEPSSIMLFGSGILGLAGMLRRKLF